MFYIIKHDSSKVHVHLLDSYSLASRGRQNTAADVTLIKM